MEHFVSGLVDSINGLFKPLATLHYDAANKQPAYFLLIPEILVALAGILILLLDMLIPKWAKRIAPYIAFIATTWAIWVINRTQFIVSRHFTVGLGQFWGGLETIDPFSLFLKTVVVYAVYVAIVISMFSKDLTRRFRCEYYGFFMLAFFSMTLVVSSSDVMAFFVMSEFVGFSFYLLSGWQKGRPQSTEAALKFMLLGSVATAIMLFGFTTLYGLTGTTNLYAMNGFFAQNEVTRAIPVFALICVATGMFFKMALAPFHQWAPDTYQGAPTAITAFLSVAPKTAYVSVFFRIFIVAFGTPEHVPSWVMLFAIVAGLSMIVGNLFALKQVSLKRLFAYSGTVQLGFIIMGLSAAGNNTLTSKSGAGGIIGSPGFDATCLYILIYAVMNIGAFLIIHMVERVKGSDHIDAFKGLIYNYPPAAFSMLFFLLSLAGVPLTAGFFAKFFIFAAAVEQQMWWLVGVAAINVVIAAYYYFRIIKVMFMREGEDRVLWDVPKLQRWTMALTLVLIVFLIPLFMKYVYIYAANAEFLNYKEFLQKFPQ